METSKITKFIYKVGNSLKKNSPAILIGMGISGMIFSSISAVKATIKAVRIVDSVKEDKELDELPPKDIVQLVWKLYLPSAISTTLSATSIIFAGTISHKRNAALATACSLSESVLHDYKDSVKKMLGPDKEKEISTNVAQKQLDKNPVQSNNVIIIDDDGVLCYDVLSGRYFKSSKNAIDKAINAVNREMINHMAASINDFYSELNLEPIKMGDQLGWNIDKGAIDIYYDYGGTEDGRPCLVIEYSREPSEVF